MVALLWYSMENQYDMKETSSVHRDAIVKLAYMSSLWEYVVFSSRAVLPVVGLRPAANCRRRHAQDDEGVCKAL